jgi:hypothetical protein
LTHLLEIFLGYFDFLYLDPQYRITDSSTSGSPTIDAQLVLTGQPLSWSITNDRGHILVAAAPTANSAPENWFRLSVIRRHLDGTSTPSPFNAEAADWLRANVVRIEGIFKDEATAIESCAALVSLENAVADEMFGPSTGDQ